MKRVAFLTGFILILFAFSSCSGSESKNENLLIEMTENIGAEFHQMDINYGGKLNDSFMSIRDINIIGLKLKDEIGIVGEKLNEIDEKSKGYVEKTIGQENFNQYTIWGMDEMGSPITIIITSYRDEETEKGETTVFLDMVLNEKYEEIDGIIDKRSKALKKNGIEAEITTCIVGTFKGKLDRDEINDKITMTINKINGKIIEDYYDNSLISVSAYTPLINEHIFIGNKKMNLNVAMRYNEYENATYIWIGTPIIAIGY